MHALGGNQRFVVAWLLSTVLALPGAAQTIVVNTDDDVADNVFVDGTLCGGGTVAQLPGANSRLSLREAIAAANGTAGDQRITFAANLKGRTIRLAFDGNDSGALPDPLPRLCGGRTEIDGDIDDDGVPDITVDGSALAGADAAIRIVSSHNRIHGLRILNAISGIVVRHAPQFAGEEGFTGNEISGNEVTGGRLGIALHGGGGSDGPPGRVDATRVVNNRVSGAEADGISVVTLAPHSVLNGTEIVGNEIFDNGGAGVAVIANAFLPESRINGVLITDNTIRANVDSAVSVLTLDSATDSQTLGVVIARNTLHSLPPADAIALWGGACRASRNRLEASVVDNFFENGSTGVDIVGGYGCDGTAGANDNVVVFDGARNRMADTPGSCWNIAGANATARRNRVVGTLADNEMLRCGLGGVAAFGGATGANGNVLELQMSNNRISGARRSGISALAGAGSGAASTANRLTLTLAGNRLVNSAFFGMALAGVLAAGNDNLLSAELNDNVVCSSGMGDINCTAAIARDGTTPVAGTSNVASVHGSGNRVDSVIEQIAGSCSLALAQSQPCVCLGDCNADGMVGVDEIITGLNVANGSASASNCGAADLDRIGGVAFDEVARALGNSLSGCR